MSLVHFGSKTWKKKNQIFFLPKLTLILALKGFFDDFSNGIYKEKWTSEIKRNSDSRLVLSKFENMLILSSNCQKYMANYTNGYSMH